MENKMFELKKKSNTAPVSAVEIGNCFEHTGEVFIRVKPPTQIGNVVVKLNKDDVMCLSLETFMLTILAGDTEVLKNSVKAESSMSYE